MKLAEPQEVNLGAGAVQAVGPLLEGLGATNVLLVLDAEAYRCSGAAAVLEPEWRRRQVERITGFEVNPKIEDVERGVEVLRRARPQAIVAVGGGSAIDLAKLIGACGVQDGPLLDYVAGRKTFAVEGPPLIVVPTTAGTGSEATHFAVVYVKGEKFSVAHAGLLPDFVVLDPNLTASLPAPVAAASGLDALCQAIESIWSVGATQESLGYASQAITLAIEHLEAAVLAPTAAARLGMMKSAHLAGKAINISKTTAPHAFSYAVTTHFGVPHGSAVALTLCPFLAYNHAVEDSTCMDPRGAQHVRERIAHIVELLGGELEIAQQRLRRLITAIGCHTRLSEVGIHLDHLPQLVAQVNAERLANNPRKLTPLSLTALLTSIA